MTAHEVARPHVGRRMRLRLGALAACALLGVVACTGENIFPLSVSTGGSGELEAPTVEITQPADNAALTVGDSVQVAASISSTNGVNQVTLSGRFVAGSPAYVQQVIALSGASDTTISKFLQPAGTVTGNARIIVEARDVLGNAGADTVLVSVN